MPGEAYDLSSVAEILALVFLPFGFKVCLLMFINYISCRHFCVYGNICSANSASTLTDDAGFSDGLVVGKVYQR